MVPNSPLAALPIETTEETMDCTGADAVARFIALAWM
jgi:hypothetical protein